MIFEYHQQNKYMNTQI